ncbi:hypothetical protein VCHA53O466_140007 [Vibrio chagasii]|nr:hypothetical protein VCHA53O466_140007 [Vibrio chagasii]
MPEETNETLPTTTELRVCFDDKHYSADLFLDNNILPITLNTKALSALEYKSGVFHYESAIFDKKPTAAMVLKHLRSMLNDIGLKLDKELIKTLKLQASGYEMLILDPN